ALEVGQPVGERQRRIPKCACKGVSEIGGCEVRPQLDDQTSDSRSRETRVKEPDQEGEGREADDRERRVLQGLKRGRQGVARADDEQACSHQEPERERIDQQRQGPASWSATTPSATCQEADADQERRAQGKK